MIELIGIILLAIVVFVVYLLIVWYILFGETKW